MTETGQDATIYQGDDKVLAVTVTDGDGNPVDLSGSSIEYALVRRTGTVVVTKDTSGDVTITDAANGEFEVALSPADTQDVDPGEYRHEVELTDSQGRVSTLLVGDVTIEPSYT